MCPLQHLCPLQSGLVDMKATFSLRCVSKQGLWTRGSLLFGGPTVISVRLNCIHNLYEAEQLLLIGIT